MDTQGNGLTLEALAQRLEALERENTELRHEVAGLRASGTHQNEVAEMRGSERRLDGEPVPVLEGRVSRRSLLSKAGAAAVAAAAAGTLFSPREAKANHSDQVVQAFHVNTHSLRAGPTGIVSTINWDNKGAVESSNDNSLGIGVKGTSSGTGVLGTSTNDSQAGVKGEGPTGVWGVSSRDTFSGVYGEHKGTAGHGTVGIGKGGHAGVLGRNLNTNGIGVQGVTNNTDGLAGVKGEGSTGVWGASSRTSHSGVYGEHTGTSGHGTVGIGKGGAAGVLGRNRSGEGVLGEGKSSGVRGVSSFDGGFGVHGEHVNSSGHGIVGDGMGPDYAGVLGRNSDGTGVWGRSSKTEYSGVYGQHTGTSGYGIVGDGTGTSAGVLGRNPGGTGVRGEGSTSAEVAGVRGLGKRGVWGSSSATGYSGVYGEHTGTSGDGVVGAGKGVGAGVLGRNNTGYGGQFEGGRAQLMLKPGVITGKPTSGAHTKGEIYMDSAGALFVCVASNTSTAAAKWRKVTTTAV